MDKKQSTSTLTSILAGGLAGASETVVTYPAEFVKTRRQLEVSRKGFKPSSSLTILRSTIANHGLSNVYSGCQTLATSNAIKSGVRFFSFETSKRYLTRVSDKNNTSINVAAGLCAGVTESIYASMPFDNIKTKMQSIGNTHTRMIRCAMHMAKTEGVKVFWKATTPRLVRLTLSSSITFMVYDHAVSIMNNLTADKAELRTMRQMA
ncbi:tricarboxylate transport protein [Aureobasidium pullulans]|nr:tricarboxylate transport protein [Aureobasidium pullulans]